MLIKINNNIRLSLHPILPELVNIDLVCPKGLAATTITNVLGLSVPIAMKKSNVSSAGIQYLKTSYSSYINCKVASSPKNIDEKKV
jgi:hypothetical protein